MDYIGKMFLLIGNMLAFLIIPCRFLGMNMGWHFILGDAGLGMKNYQFLDTATLLLELILINGIGFAVVSIGKNKGGKRMSLFLNSFQTIPSNKARVLYCTNCGSKITPDILFCEQCGNKIND